LGFFIDMETEKTTVGTSSRTPFKHWLYNAMLGKVAGATSTGKAMGCTGMFILEMCAGAGLDIDSIGSSPTLAKRHTEWLLSKGMPARAVLYERERLTFDRLQARIEQSPTVKAIHGTSENLTLYDLPILATDSVMIYADPNSVATLPVSQDLVASFNHRTLFLMTLGCNASGIKRNSIEDRRKWYDVARMIIRSVKRHHDIQLIWLNGDSHQWAYMSAVPIKWSLEMMQSALKVGNDPKRNMWPHGVSALSLKHQGEGRMMEKLRELFLTQKEKEEGVRP
jgi:hypothetical protein